MVEKVMQWKTADGSNFDTKEAADAHEYSAYMMDALDLSDDQESFSYEEIAEAVAASHDQVKKFFAPIPRKKRSADAQAKADAEAGQTEQKENKKLKKAA